MLTFRSAGKPLRIKLSSRLGIGCLTDVVPTLFRHFEAEVPSSMAALSDRIPCSRVSIDLGDVHRILASFPGIKDFAFRSAHGESVEVFVSLDAESRLDSEDIKSIMAQALPGYSIPNTLHILGDRPLRRTNGEVDFTFLESEVTTRQASGMSNLELQVRDILAELLVMDPGKIASDSDFFLLGGTSLLLGKLSYHLRKLAGASVAVTALFNNTTVREIASLIEGEADRTPVSSSFSAKTDSDTLLSSADTLGNYEYDYERDVEDLEGATSRNPSSPCGLMVQALPFALFYPLKSALNCACHVTLKGYITVERSLHRVLHPLCTITSCSTQQ